jgi:protein-S-isoprenylcysteine O-methyltransferase Ste14
MVLKMYEVKKMLKLNVPPALQFLIGIVGIWYINKSWSNNWLQTDFNGWLSLTFLILAGVIGIQSLIEFYRHSTSVNPHKPEHASTLVTSGVYRFSRNPMYVALLFGLIAPVLYWGNAYSAMVPVLFVWYMNEFQIKSEEETMAEKFDSKWHQYQSQVRRWI